MGLEKAILYNKEHRKSYRKSKRFDKTCRNHGKCSWCRRNRLYNNLKLEEKIKELLKDFDN